MRLRISILQQSAASEQGDSSSSSSDEKRDDTDAERRRASTSGSTSPAAVTEKWTAMFEASDRAGTGRATEEVLRGVLEEVKKKYLDPEALGKDRG